MQDIIEVGGIEKGLKCCIFENGLLKGHPFRLRIDRKKVRITQEMMSMVESYMILAERLSTHFDNLIPVDANHASPGWKESYRHWDDSDQAMQGHYDK